MNCLSRVIVSADRVTYYLNANCHRAFSLACTGGFGHYYPNGLLRSLCFVEVFEDSNLTSIVPHQWHASE